MTHSNELPFGIKNPPQVTNTKSAQVDVEDYLTKSNILVNTWGNGEGIDILVDEERLELSWAQWDAIKLAVKSLLQEEKEGVEKTPYKKSIIDDIVSRANKIISLDKNTCCIDTAVWYLNKTLKPLLLTERVALDSWFAYAVRWFKKVDEDVNLKNRMHDEVMLTMLKLTLPHKDEYQNRPQFFSCVRKEYVKRNPLKAYVLESLR